MFNIKQFYVVLLVGLALITGSFYVVNGLVNRNSDESKSVVESAISAEEAAKTEEEDVQEQPPEVTIAEEGVVAIEGKVESDIPEDQVVVLNELPVDPILDASQAKIEKVENLTYYNEFFPNFELVYPSSWILSSNSVQAPDFQSLNSQVINLQNGDKTIVLTLEPLNEDLCTSPKLSVNQVGQYNNIVLDKVDDRQVASIKQTCTTSDYIFSSIQASTENGYNRVTSPAKTVLYDLSVEANFGDDNSDFTTILNHSTFR